MKIVNTDNLGGDYPDEKFVAENISSEEQAKVMCEALNEKYSGDYASRYFKVVADDYVLQPGFEP